MPESDIQYPQEVRRSERPVTMGRPLPATSFLPPETVDMIIQYGPDFPMDLAFEEEMSVLFSDMRGFTEMAESHDPHQVYAAINASLAIQTKLVLSHGGSVNKFLGDGLLACFSGENRNVRAVDCVLEMAKTLRERENQHDLLPCPVGFGLNDGKVLLGILASKERREFTVLGDVVNTAARLCGIASPFQALMTEDAVDAIPKDMAKNIVASIEMNISRVNLQLPEFIA